MLYPRKKMRKEKKRLLSLIQQTNKETQDKLKKKAEKYDVTALSLVIDMMRNHIEKPETKEVLENASLFANIRLYCFEKDISLTDYIEMLVKDEKV